jgi:hypothetical protein
MHPTFLWGGAYLLTVEYLSRAFIGTTVTWLKFAGWMTS